MSVLFLNKNDRLCSSCTSLLYHVSLFIPFVANSISDGMGKAEVVCHFWDIIFSILIFLLMEKPDNDR